MKYAFIAFAAIVLITIAFMKGVAAGNAQTAETDSPCSSESILKTDNPDARFSHCRDHDWGGSTLLKKRLAEAQDHPTEYGMVCSDDRVRFAILPSLIQPEAPDSAHEVPPFELVPTRK
ncbi:MAG TPA: hypothetical protein VI685_23590 [Candidatus Angelobacter sp.]